MTTKRFYTSKSIIDQIFKGDVEGHQFHGNQWEQVASEGLSELPQGWAKAPEAEGQNPNQVVLVSQKGNKAIFPKEVASDKWNPSSPLAKSAMLTIDKFSTGKTLDFDGIDVPPTVLGRVNGSAPSTIQIGQLQTWSKPMPEEDKDAPRVGADGVIETAKESMDANKFSPYYFYSTTANMLSDPETKMAAVVCHELGHSEFQLNGGKISQIYSALDQAAKDDGYEGRKINWQKATESANARYAKSIFGKNYYGQPLYDSITIGGQKMNQDQFIQHLNEDNWGGAKLTDKQSTFLNQTLGVSKYGSSKLSELVGEAKCIWLMPQFHVPSYVSNIAKALNWAPNPDKVY